MSLGDAPCALLGPHPSCEKKGREKKKRRDWRDDEGEKVKRGWEISKKERMKGKGEEIGWEKRRRKERKGDGGID